MSSYKLENDQLKLSVSSSGAEMKSLIRKSDGKEILWQADPAFWGRTSPILFPLVGNYYEKTSIYKGKSYRMSQHGFARDMDFHLDHGSDHDVLFWLEENRDTLQKYPFPFKLEIGYKLEENSVLIEWTVHNTGDDTMYFSIGGHPAFNCNLEESKLMFSKEEETVTGPLICNIIANDGSGCLSDRQKSIALDSEHHLPMTYGLFSEDALIIEGEQADAVTLIDESNTPILEVSFNAPLFGLWTPVGKNAPFVCIEPWYGRCDRAGFNQKLEEREYGNALEPDGRFAVTYRIKVF